LTEVGAADYDSRPATARRQLLSMVKILEIMKNLELTDIVPNRIVITPPEDVGDNKDCDSADEETNNPDNLNHNQPAAQGNTGFGATDTVRENRMDACAFKKLAEMKRLRRGEMDSAVATHNNKSCTRSLEAQQYCNNIV
ncbi:hypothetical protein ILUMI_10564, partial [Ignelater luminosus]